MYIIKYKRTHNMHINPHACMHALRHIDIYVHTHTHTHTHTRTHTHTHTNTHTHTHTHTKIHTQIHAHTRTHKTSHKNTHTHTDDNTKSKTGKPGHNSGIAALSAEINKIPRDLPNPDPAEGGNKLAWDLLWNDPVGSNGDNAKEDGPCVCIFVAHAHARAAFRSLARVESKHPLPCSDNNNRVSRFLHACASKVTHSLLCARTLSLSLSRLRRKSGAWHGACIHSTSSRKISAPLWIELPRACPRSSKGWLSSPAAQPNGNNLLVVGLLRCK